VGKINNVSASALLVQVSSSPYSTVAKTGLAGNVLASVYSANRKLTWLPDVLRPRWLMTHPLRNLAKITPSFIKRMIPANLRTLLWRIQ
jgi:hypothetical protein